MSSDAPDAPDAVADRIENVRVEDEMEQSYIDYAMSVIAGRALPDVRDGLKPVHRRILYAMHEAGVTSGSAHRKSSSIVGETMGDYHPHGDSAIYDTLVRMAQPFSMREPLVDGQGNFGSVDGDPAAAMRYTEARMAPIAEELLADIDMDTVDFESNYDGRLEEPAVLPSAFPNLLVNGSSGIAVGMSTNVPPHNLGEVIDATIHLIENPECSIPDLMEHLPAPDFPTGANIVGRSAIRKAYHTGRGRLRVRAEYHVEEGERGDSIVITELPYQQNKSRLVERIAEDVNDGTLEGVRDLRDESDRDGIRVVVELKSNANTDIVENHLLESHLERTFGVINLALVDGQPEVLSLKETLEHYLDHRKEVVRRRSEYELTEAEDRAHILDGRLKALENAEDVVETIRGAENRDDARAALEDEYGFSGEQAAHIVRMQLGSLTSMEAAEIEDEYAEVTARIERLEEILGDEDELLGVIEDELREIKDEYANERRTRVVEEAGEVTDEDLIPEERVVVTLSEGDYIKRTPVETFSTQHRGGKGVIGADLKEGDRVSTVFTASTHDYLLCFTNQGQVYRLKVYQVPEMSRTARGTSAVNVVDLDDGEEITAVVTADDLDFEADEEYLTMATRDGYVKRTAVSEFANIRSTGIRAVRLEHGDELVDVEVTDGESDVVVSTEEGMAIRFDETEARPMGRSARGVRGVKLEGGDRVSGVAAARSDDERDLMTVTEYGYGKRTALAQYRRQSRNGKGLVDIKTGQRNGRVASVHAVAEGDEFVAMSEDGQIMRASVSEVSEYGRNTQGVTVMDLVEHDRLAAVDVFTPDDADDEATDGADE
ncbi:DNA gyrase subunit A [Halarchaeum rubridurum]|uniref:DNA gyrase subunit A n=1 Tax=Halarchaeum rubridurum TaxID=489911 RepID=A0A830FVK6_9EURY|nr:DNA gyrase subunit A [Halarchaeum rubridurum]MBP1953376.1 DNA gyrase subunit A [Halarchaeum rubridurum]GGM65770.1 DNA gyrase subunit A [Halarchaeum rubridurum]